MSVNTRSRLWMKLVALFAFSLLIILNIPLFLKSEPENEIAMIQVQEDPPPVIQEIPSQKFDVKNFLQLLSEQRKSEKPASRKHIVVKGDTLSGISLKYYGTSKRWIQIYEANKNLIPDKNNIRTGITLTLP